MYRTLDDFKTAWGYERESTLKVLRALTDQSLGQAVGPGGRTLGRLAWHVVGAVAEMGEHMGLEVPGARDTDPQPSLAEMVRQYESASARFIEAVTTRWTDAMLLELIPMYGEQWPRGGALTALVMHQAHHRGQMTVLMRQAGLKVPGIYGPAAEEWAAMNMPAQP